MCVCLCVCVCACVCVCVCVEGVRSLFQKWGTECPTGVPSILTRHLGSRSRCGCLPVSASISLACPPLLPPFPFSPSLSLSLPLCLLSLELHILHPPPFLSPPYTVLRDVVWLEHRDAQAGMPPSPSSPFPAPAQAGRNPPPLG